MVGAAGLIDEQSGYGPATCVFKRGCHVHLLFWWPPTGRVGGVEAVTMVENAFHYSFLLTRPRTLVINCYL